MHPILFEFGGFPIYSYGVLLAAAYLLGLQFALMRARRARPRSRTGSWTSASGSSSRAGRREAAAAHRRLRQVHAAAARDFLDLARSGGVFYGGLIAAVAVALWYLRRHKLPLWTTTDVFAPGIALGHVVGRLGCLLAGCCFGRPTTCPGRSRSHDPAAAANVGTPLGVPLHPTQLYEAGAEAADPRRSCSSLERRGRPFPGRTFWSYMLLYGISRFIIEFYRGDPRGMVVRRPLDVAVRVGASSCRSASSMLLLLSRRPIRRGSRAPAQRESAA